MKSTVETLKGRTSLRIYDDTPIKAEDLDTIIECAMRAPTAGNMMMYSVITVKDKHTKEKLSKTCDNQAFIANAPVVLVFLADVQKWMDYFKLCRIDEYCDEKNVEFVKPHEGTLLLAANDAIIAAQNAVIAAESLGIGSCYIGDILENYEKQSEILKLPKYAVPVTMLCMGYYPKDYKKIIKPRFDKENIVFEEEYKRLDKNTLKNMFDNRGIKIDMSKFDADNFGQFIYKRKFGNNFAKEMRRSVKAMLKRWNE